MADENHERKDGRAARRALSAAMTATSAESFKVMRMRLSSLRANAAMKSDAWSPEVALASVFVSVEGFFESSDRFAGDVAAASAVGRRRRCTRCSPCAAAMAGRARSSWARSCRESSRTTSKTCMGGSSTAVSAGAFGRAAESSPTHAAAR